MKRCADAKHELAPWTLHLAAAAAERLSHEEDAAAYNQAQLDRHPEHRLADDAGFFLVRHHLDDKKDYKAAKSLAESLVKRFPAALNIDSASSITEVSTPVPRLKARSSTRPAGIPACFAARTCARATSPT